MMLIQGTFPADYVNFVSNILRWVRGNIASFWDFHKKKICKNMRLLDFNYIRSDIFKFNMNITFRFFLLDINRIIL
jgi:intergrase/recombinase